MSTTETEVTAEASQEGGRPGPQEGNTAGPGGGGTQENEEQTFSAEDARKLRSEAYQLRQRLKEAETKLSDREKAEMSELERATKAAEEKTARVTALEDENRALRVQVAAGKVGIKPDLVDAVPSMLDWADIDPSDPKALERALKQLLRDRPSLAVGSSNGGGFEGGAGRSNIADGGGVSDMNALLRRAAGRA